MIQMPGSLIPGLIAMDGNPFLFGWEIVNTFIW
jgi:hypothetical protein